MKIKALWLITVIFVLAGCSSTPELIVENALGNPVEGLDQAIPLPSGLIKAELDSDDMVVIMNQTFRANGIKMAETEDFYTSMDLYKADLEEGSYKLEIRSLGNMMGFNKTIMLPLITLMDSEGNMLPISNSNYTFIDAPGRYPANAWDLISLDIPAEGTYYIGIYADNSQENRLVGSLWSYIGLLIFPPEGMAIKVNKNLDVLGNFPISRSPFAKYVFTLEKE